LARAKEILDNRLAQYGHRGTALIVLLGQETASSQWPIAHSLIFRRYPRDRCTPVLVAGDHLLHLSTGVGHRAYRRAFPLNRFGVANPQRRTSAGPCSHTTLGDTARENHQHIVAHAGNLLLHCNTRPLANADHGNDCSDADNNAQNGEERTQGVTP
jgi:hypothetical protein